MALRECILQGLSTQGILPELLRGIEGTTFEAVVVELLKEPEKTSR
jgi:hypothetical protein